MMKMVDQTQRPPPPHMDAGHLIGAGSLEGYAAMHTKS